MLHNPWTHRPARQLSSMQGVVANKQHFHNSTSPPPASPFLTSSRPHLYQIEQPFCSLRRMQRPAYGQSPPLHHPVPQHVSTVPQLRSPPPPIPQQQHQQTHGYDGSPYQQQPMGGGAGPSNNMFGQYGNFMNDPAAQLASQFGQTAFKQGTQYLEQNVSSPLPLHTHTPTDRYIAG